MLVEKGWPVRHPLGVPRDSWVKNLFHVTDTCVMIYGPRDEKEMIVLETILRRSISFMTGQEVGAIE